MRLHFEYGGPDPVPLGKTSLGEKGQTTQIDVALEAQHANGKSRFLLIEVKLSESSFGANNADCNRLGKVLAAPQNKCWLVKNEGRKYWPVIQGAPRALQFESIAGGPCPWKGGLY